MKKTTILPILGLTLVAAVFLTAFSLKPAIKTDPEITFESFLQQFPAQQLPYALDENSIKVRLDQYVTEKKSRKESGYRFPSTAPRRLNWEFYRFLPELQAESNFSRLPMHAEPIALFTTADNFAVLFSTSRSYYSGYCTYSIAVFDKSGKYISTNTVGKVMPQTIVSATISNTLQADLKTWTIEWQKDYDKKGLDGNKITGLSYVDAQSINLTTPTPVREHFFKRESIAPQVPIEKPAEVEGIKTK